MLNQIIKSNLIKEGKDKLYNEIRYNAIKDNNLYINVFDNATGELIGKKENKNIYNNNFTDIELKNCEQLRRNKKEQTNKIKLFLDYYTKYRNDCEIYFGTYTYDDKKFKGKIETLKRQIIKTINNDKNVIDYVINIDYGKENERQHFHSIEIRLKDKKHNHIKVNRKVSDTKYTTGLKLITNQLQDYEQKYGFYDMEPCKITRKDKTKISKYISKLVSHSVKVKQSYLSKKKGSDFQRWQKDRKMVNDVVKKTGVYNNKCIDIYTRYIDRPQNENFIRELRKATTYEQTSLDLTMSIYCPLSSRGTQKRASKGNKSATQSKIKKKDRCNDMTSEQERVSDTRNMPRAYFQ